MRGMLMRGGGRVSLAAVIVLAASAGLAYAAIPDGGGRIDACMLKNVGTIRLIDTAKSGLAGRCSTLETAVSWGATGPAGADGAAGAAGPAGPAGPKGDPGPAGGGAVLAAVISRGCASIYDGSDAIATSKESAGRCNVKFNRNLTGCKSVIQPRPSIGYLNSDTMASIAPGEMIGITFSNFPNDAVAVQGRATNGAFIPVEQFGEFKLLVFC
jgi:hypothetical protein